MAGGIDWFRWHHGSVNDPKFQLVAKKAGASVGEVIAVWACLLEAASLSSPRGNPGDIDLEALDCSLGFEDGKCARIYARMTERGLIAEDGRVASWDKRQPKRERDDDSSTERVRAFRERERHETPRNASDGTGTPRGEESREEEKEEPTVLVGKPTASRPAACPTERLIALYHEHLPMLPRVEVLNDSRRRALSARWRQVVTDPDIAKALDPREAALEWFAWYFQRCASSRFLTGKAKDWRADFDFLMLPTKFAKVVEGHYHKERA